MKSSPLYQVFSTLNKKEVRELKLRLRSRAFNQREDTRQLFDYLVKTKPDKGKLLEKESIFRVLFPGKEYEDEKIRNTQFYLLKLIKTYLIHQEDRQDTAQQQIQLCKAYSKRGLDHLFEKEWKKTTTSLQQQSYRHSHYHHHNFLLHQEYVNYTLRNKRSDPIDMGTTMRELKIYYLAETLRLSCAMLSQQQLTQKAYDLQEVQEVIQNIEQGDYLSLPAIAIYYYGYLLLTETDTEKHFATFKKILNENGPQFPTRECKGLYLMAINYCIRQLNQDKNQFIREAFSLYQDGLQRDVLLEDGLLSKFTYNNIMTLAINLSEWDWAARFLDEYKKHLPQKERENTYVYNRAIFYFRKPDYQQAMQLLRQVEFKDVLYNLNSRRMLARIYFELDEFDALDALLDSFNVYLRRQKQLGYHKENYLNFISFLRKMLRSNMNSKAVRQQLADQLHPISAIVEKQWLLEQLRS